MAALITTINRYQGVSGDSKPSDAPAGSTFYEVDTGSWFVWDGDSWEAYTFPLLDATSPTLPSTDEKAALFAAASPSAANPVLTEAALADAATLPALAAAVGIPEIPATPVAQDIVDALLALGIVTQAV
jgi:hypothetical protein